MMIPYPAFASDPWADQVVDASPTLNGSGLYNDPARVLGETTTTFYDNFTGRQLVTSLAVGAFNRDAPGGNKVVTTLNAGQFIKLEFDEPVEDHPRNPYGIDLIVFGNAFFTASGFVTPETNMETLVLSGGIFAEEVIVAVSATGIGSPQTNPAEWYVYVDGPFGDELFPTNARQWDRAAHAWGDPCDFTLPVDPLLGIDDFDGLSAADAIDLYEGAGGGAGFDLAQSGFPAIQYVYLTSSGGEVDALTDVFPCLGDLDRDEDLDLADFADVQTCFGAQRPAQCRCMDFDADHDVDLGDYESFTSFMTGVE